MLPYTEEEILDKVAKVAAIRRSCIRFSGLVSCRRPTPTCI